MHQIQDVQNKAKRTAYETPTSHKTPMKPQNANPSKPNRHPSINPRTHNLKSADYV